MNEEDYNRFLKNLYDLLLKDNIMMKKPGTYMIKGRQIKLSKASIIKDYFDKLERIHHKAYQNEELLKRIKNLYYDKYIIHPDDIPQTYWEKLSNTYLEEGHGHCNLVNPQRPIEHELKKEHITNIIHDQISSLDAWLNYLISPDSAYLPIWAKVWAFQGMLHIGTLNKNKDGYNKREHSTVNPFVEINSEVLGKSVEYLKKHLNKEDFDDEEIKKLANTESFAKIYGSLLIKAKPMKQNGKEGIWIKYRGGSEEEAKRLYQDIQGYNTGWCTASSLEVAKNQLCGNSSYMGGDFYVYYSKDENNEYKIPRIAIRMDKEQIGEIRGIAKNQNIEQEMEEILEEKLKEFSDGKIYIKKVSDMKELTKIYKKYQKEELTKEEIMFLYETEDRIQGFGYQIDPRIEEIKKTRNKKKDFCIAFDCNEDEVTDNIHFFEKNKKKIKVFIGNIDSEEDIKDTNLIYLCGNLDLSDATSTEGLILPRIIRGTLNLYSLTSTKGLVLPKMIGKDLILSKLTSSEGLVLPEMIGRDLILSKLTSSEGLVLPKTVGGYLILSSLTSAKGLILPETIEGSLGLPGLTSAKGLVLPKTINGALDLSNLTSAEGLVLPKMIGGDLNLYNLTSAEDLVLPNTMNGDLDLSNLTSAEGLVLPKMIGGDLYITKLTIDDLLNVALPNQVQSIYLNSSIVYTLPKLREAIERRKEELGILDTYNEFEENLKR